ncbi:MAG: glutamate--tRNA ligase, partial [Cyclobacteriaceae bacterium]
WFNQQYLRAKSDEELSAYLINDLNSQNISCAQEKASLIVSALRDRITFPEDLVEMGKLFFVAPTSFDEKIISKKWNQDAVSVLSELESEMKNADSLTPTSAAEILESITSRLNISQGKIMQALRLALTGGASGPDLMATMSILGAGEVASRLDYALQTLKGKVS